MKNLLDFINEVQRINVTVNRYYSVLNNWFAENEIPAEKRSDLQMKDFLQVNMSSPETIGDCYNGAKMDLILLTDEQRKSVLKSLQSFNYKRFYSEVSEFYQRYIEGEDHPMHVAYFYEFLRNNFLCTIPENGEISLKFLDDLISEVGNKYSFCEALINDITENSTPPPPPPPPTKLIKSLTINQQTYLFKKLTEDSLFLPVGTDFDSFCFVFGNSMKPENFKPLKWLKNRQLLREIITTLKHPDITIPTSKYKLPPYFLDEKENPIAELPTNTPKDLKIEHYIYDLAKM